MPEKLTEITRSYSRKINLANYDKTKGYETIDIFASQKEECLEKDADKVSEKLFKFCKEEVEKCVEKELDNLRGNAMNNLAFNLEKTKKGRDALKSEKENEWAEDAKRPPITEEPFTTNEEMAE